MGGFSHYRFDLNRDTLAMTQKETQNMQAAFHALESAGLRRSSRPAVADFFSAGFAADQSEPAAAVLLKWNEMYGRANAAAFDANHWDYYVRDIFDAFYPGYWDMYPSLNGAIGMTYETDGGGFKGLSWTRDDGTIVDPPFGDRKTLRRRRLTDARRDRQKRTIG